MSTMCRVYDVTRSGYYAWRHRGKSLREHEDERLLEDIKRIHEVSRGTYGSPRIHRSLRQEGTRVGRKRVERIMQETGVKARAAKLYKSKAAQKAFYRAIPNHELERRADSPNQVWVSDITYLKVGSAVRYLAVVMDKCSRKIIGWSLGATRDAKLTLKALQRAVYHRRPRAGLIFHTDRGIEFSAFVFRNKLASLGIIQSMNRPRRMTDNAHMESFFQSFKSDGYHGCTFSNEAQLRRMIESYMPFYNERRIHSAIGYLSPVQFERQL